MVEPIAAPLDWKKNACLFSVPAGRSPPAWCGLHALPFFWVSGNLNPGLPKSGARTLMPARLGPFLVAAFFAQPHRRCRFHRGRGLLLLAAWLSRSCRL